MNLIYSKLLYFNVCIKFNQNEELNSDKKH